MYYCLDDCYYLFEVRCTCRTILGKLHASERLLVMLIFLTPGQPHEVQ